MRGGMQVWFNDEPLACADNLSVSALLTQLEQQQLALRWRSINILPRDRWEDHLLQEGDRVLLSGLSLEADMLRIADKTVLNPIFSPVPANSPPRR